MNAQHVILDLPPQYEGGEPGRRCCMCNLPEAIAARFPRCNKKTVVGYTMADAKTAHRARRRKRRSK